MICIRSKIIDSYVDKIILEVNTINTAIYIFEINKSLDSNQFNDLLKVISIEKREKCRKFMFKEDALRTMYGELIIRHILVGKFLFRNQDIEFFENLEGKPYLKDIPIYFNISHAGNFIVCAFSEQEIGIDIEEIKEGDLEIAERFFCQCEYEDLMMQRSLERIDYFYSLWTLKESYVKWLGKGLTIPLDSFCFFVKGEDISCVDYYRNRTPFFKQYPIEGYKISVCATLCDFPERIEEIRIDDVLEFGAKFSSYSKRKLGVCEISYPT